MRRRVADRKSVDDARPCAWCTEARIPATRRGWFCSRRCRQSAFRLRRRSAPASRADLATIGVDDVSSYGPSLAPGARFAYADPPYLGLSKRFYQHEASYRGEVDHAQLIASLTAGRYAGWALSASSRSLATLLPLCPPEVRVCAWVKPIGLSGRTWGLHNTWETVIVAGGRPTRPGVRDWLRAMPARGGGKLMGRKPLAFCAWLFDLLGMVAGDELVDLFPGTGIISRAWRELASYERPRVASLIDQRRTA